MAQIYWFLGHEQFQPEELIKQAQAVENAGFDGVLVSEHLQPWVDDQGAAGFAFSTLGAIAATTNKIKLMTGVTTPLFRYHPAVVAQAAATIDRISQGRFELGIGTGEYLNESLLGQEFPDYAERSARIIEAIQIMKQLLDGQKVNFEGKYYQVKNLKLYSPPITKVPILMAAGGPKSAQTAEQYCDGIIISVKNIQETLDNLLKPTNFSSSGTRLVASNWSIYANNDTEAWEVLGPWRGLRAPNRAVTNDPVQLQQEADRLDHGEIISKYQRIHEISDYLKVYAPLITDLKAETIVIQTTSLNQLATIQAVGREVLTSLRNL